MHLEALRCDGQAHGGCQAGCLLYWKEAWLKRAEAEEPEPAGGNLEPAAPAHRERRPEASSGRTPSILMAATRRSTGTTPSSEEAFSCQATELMRAAPDRIPPWDVRQYVVDVRSGNAGALATIRTLCIGLFNEFQDLSKRFLPRPLLIRGGERFPFIRGKLHKTPDEALGLAAGDLVRVKRREEIIQTLDTDNKNRGMKFDAEMLKYCGRQARVLRRVDRIIDERSGRMMQLKNPCILLENVICTSDYHPICPRSIYPYWREIWLERVE